MPVPFPGFIGPSYMLDDKYAAVERTVNWYLVANESPEEGKFREAFSPCPGNAQFSALPPPGVFKQANRGLLEYRGTPYGVNGTTVFYLDQNGSYHQIGGAIATDGKPVSMVGNGNGQIAIASAGQLWVINTSGAAPTLTPIPVTDMGFLGASFVTFQDGYLLCVTPNSNQFQISGTDAVPLGDMTQWTAANVSVQAGQQDLLAAIISSREYVRLLGNRRSQVYYDAGANGIGGFPFQSYNETFLETGIAAPFSLNDLGDSLMWIGEDARGRRACWRDSLFKPDRVSTFGVEYVWQNYPTVADAVAFSFIWLGHLIYQVTFPTANATWWYDATVSQLLGRNIWSERSFHDSAGRTWARPEQFHCFCYGRHLVGSTGADGLPGAVYQYQALPPGGLHYDFGVDLHGNPTTLPIIRDRIVRAPFADNKRVIHNRIEFEFARGVGLPGNIQGYNPEILLKWSNDGGNTWGRELPLRMQEIGAYTARAYLLRLGYGRDRVYWTRCADPVYNGMVNAFLDMTVCSN